MKQEKEKRKEIVVEPNRLYTVNWVLKLSDITNKISVAKAQSLTKTFDERVWTLKNGTVYVNSNYVPVWLDLIKLWLDSEEGELYTDRLTQYRNVNGNQQFYNDIYEAEKKNPIDLVSDLEDIMIKYKVNPEKIKRSVSEPENIAHRGGCWFTPYEDATLKVTTKNRNYLNVRSFEYQFIIRKHKGVQKFWYRKRK